MNTSTPSFTCISVWVFAWGEFPTDRCIPSKRMWSNNRIYLVAKLSCIIVYKFNVIFTLKLVFFFFTTHYKILIAVFIEPSGTYQYIYIFIYLQYQYNILLLLQVMSLGMCLCYIIASHVFYLLLPCFAEYILSQVFIPT